MNVTKSTSRGRPSLGNKAKSRHFQFKTSPEIADQFERIRKIQGLEHAEALRAAVSLYVEKFAPRLLGNAGLRG